MARHPTDGNLDALERHLAWQEQDDTPPPDDWDDEEQGEYRARRKFSDREDW